MHMKKVLIVKTSSMGDLIHAFPALTDAARAYPEAEFHWLAESSFVEIPRFHSAVSKTIEVSWRNWRHKLWQKSSRDDIHAFLTELRQTKYDRIVDLQGLLKSAVMARLAHGQVAGPDKASAREWFASWLYHKPCQATYQQHVLQRNRQLMAKALDYTYDVNRLDYGLKQTIKVTKSSNQIIFIHGTSLEAKEWPVANWIELAKRMHQHGLEVVLPWGTERERLRAQYIAKQTQAVLLPKLSLTELKQVIEQARAAVAVDTGLGYLAAALQVPCISIYPVTNAEILAVKGPGQAYCAPDQHNEIKTSTVYQKLLELGVL